MDTHISEAQQYFPTYRLTKDSEIGIKEYEQATKALDANQKALNVAAGIAVFAGGSAATILSSTEAGRLKEYAEDAGTQGLVISLAILLIASTFLIHYFSHLQRSATYAARKIIVLRRLLGLDYGHIESVLPSDKLDGANEPFIIKMFPGIRSLEAIPALAVSLLAGAISAAVTSAMGGAIESSAPANISVNALEFTLDYYALAVGSSTSLILILTYRLSLMEKHESFRFIISKLLLSLLSMPPKENLGHTLYRLDMAVYEAKRIKLNLAQMDQILIHVEDRRFMDHGGNSLLAVLRAAYRRVRFGTRSGGSTLTQQLVRTNFLDRLKPTATRKVAEWLLAPWIESYLGKRGVLEAYLVSVRFARGKYGLSEGIRHFFPDQNPAELLAPYQRFLLVERLSNVTDTFPKHRVQKLLNDCRQAKLLQKCDVARLNNAYKRLQLEGKVSGVGDGPGLQ